MRKVISLVLVAAMLVGGIMFTTGVSAKAELEDNVEATAYYFDGNVVFKEAFGMNADYDYEDPVDVKDGNEAHTLTIDGVIEEGEWGGKAVHVDARYAASNQSPIGTWLSAVKNDAAYQHPSAENTYFCVNQQIGKDDQNNRTDKSFFDYDLYFMWDEKFLYVGAHVNDPYNHQNIHDGAEAWEGDALQFMVDPAGPNSAAVADGTTYAYRAEHGIIHSKDKNNNDITLYDNGPWAGAVIGTGGVLYTPVSNFVVGYTSKLDGYTELWDAALRYHPYEQEFQDTDEAGELFTNTRTVWQTAGIMASYQDPFWKEQDIAAYATVKPVNHGEGREVDYTTDYEIAIPWEMVTRANNDGTFPEYYKAEAGNELGISVACLNASRPGNGTWDSWLGWGSGVCGYQGQWDEQTAGGSNLLTLSATNYKDREVCEHDFYVATCTTPETCSKCGYQRGFESGHNFVCSNEVLPTAEADGSVVATCVNCTEVKNLVLNKNNPERYFGFSETDTAITNKMGPSGWLANWYNQPDEDPDTDGMQGAQMLYYKDADGALKTKTSFDNWTFPGISVIDAATSGEGLFLSDGTVATFTPEHKNADGKVIKKSDYSSQTGTYFDAETIGASYTFKTDVMPTSYNEANEGHVKGFYIWYGKKVVDYMAGLFVFNGEESNTYIFAVANTDKCDGITEDVELFKKNAEVYVEVPESVVATNKWHQFAAMYDDDAQYVSVYWDGKLMVSAHNSQFKYVNAGNAYTLLRRMSIPVYMKNVDYASTAYMNNYVSSGNKYIATVNGVDAEYSAGEVVALTASKGESYVAAGKTWRFGGWKGDVEVIENASLASTTFTMPEADVAIEEVYYMVGDLNTDGKINPVDANLIKQMVTGAMTKTPAADINSDGKVNPVDVNLLKSIVTGAGN